MGSPWLLPMAGGRRKKEARDRSGGFRREVAKEGVNAPRHAGNSSQRRETFTWRKLSELSC